MGPSLQYKLSSASQHAQTPQWLLDTLRHEHGSLHDPYPHSPSADGLRAPWSSTEVNFVNSPFAHAGTWLHKAAEEATKHKQSIVLVPFRPHTRYMSHALQHAVSVCVLSKPIRFEDANGNPFNRPLPTAVCLVSFGADLAPRTCTPVAHTAVVHLNTSSASVENVAEYEGNALMENAAPFVHQSQVQHGTLQQSRGRAPYSALRVLPMPRCSISYVQHTLLYLYHHRWLQKANVVALKDRLSPSSQALLMRISVRHIVYTSAAHCFT